MPHFYHPSGCVDSPPPPSGAQIRSHVRSYGIRGEERGIGAGILPVPRFPLPIFFLQTATHILLILSSTLCRPDTNIIVK
jgi:hypothetical protein